MSYQQDYFNKVYADVLEAAISRQVAMPEIIATLGAAQSCLETGYGKHSVGGNYFGIKAVGGQPAVSAMTREVIGGREVVLSQDFATFATPKDSAYGYVDFLIRYPNHYAAILAATTGAAALDALGKSGYATAPDYESVVSGIMHNYGAHLTVAVAPAAVAPPAELLTADDLNAASLALGPQPLEIARLATRVASLEATVGALVTLNTTMAKALKLALQQKGPPSG